MKVSHVCSSNLSVRELFCYISFLPSSISLFPYTLLCINLLLPLLPSFITSYFPSIPSYSLLSFLPLCYITSLSFFFLSIPSSSLLSFLHTLSNSFPSPQPSFLSTLLFLLFLPQSHSSHPLYSLFPSFSYSSLSLIPPILSTLSFSYSSLSLIPPILSTLSFSYSSLSLIPPILSTLSFSYSSLSLISPILSTLSSPLSPIPPSVSFLPSSLLYLTPNPGDNKRLLDHGTSPTRPVSVPACLQLSQHPVFLV